MTNDTDDPFLTIDEAARLLRVSRRTLDNYRCRKLGPPYRRHGAASSTGSVISWHGPSSVVPAIRRRTSTATRSSTMALLGARLDRPRVLQAPPRPSSGTPAPASRQASTGSPRSLP